MTVLEVDKTVRRTLSRCISMYFAKERYTPYSFFRGSFYIDEDFADVFDIEVTVNGTLVHKGIVDTCEVKRTSSHKVLNVTSRGYSFALGYNELADGIVYKVDLAMLMTQRVVLPFVTYEANTKVADYLYVKPHTSMWDAVVNLCLKNENTHPYIAYPNMVRFTKHSSPKTLVLTDKEVMAVSAGSDLSKIVSDIHMKDTNDSYGSFNASSAYASDRNIVRHKYIDLDRQWLVDPVEGLVYRLNYSSRGHDFTSVTYCGFYGEDINDIVSVSGGVLNKYISKVEVFGGKTGIVTRLTAYKDAYCNK